MVEQRGLRVQSRAISHVAAPDYLESREGFLRFLKRNTYTNIPHERGVRLTEKAERLYATADSSTLICWLGYNSW